MELNNESDTRVSALSVWWMGMDGVGSICSFSGVLAGRVT